MHDVLGAIAAILTTTAFLPQALRTSNLIEGRRDPASGMTAFLSGPSSNLLAPSFGGWALDNGRHAWSWMGWIRSWVMIARSGGVTRYFMVERAVERALVRSVGRDR